MTPERWHRARQVFEQALEAPFTDQVALIDRLCGNDAALRGEVESLLVHHGRLDERFLKPPRVRLSLETKRLESWAESLIGQKLGPFTALRVVGHGGMGCVFEAQQEHPHRAVALKVLPPGFSAPAALARFRLEPEMLGRLQHPHIAQVYEAGVHEDATGLVPYFAMEFIPDAQPLIEYANAHGLSTREKLTLFATVCDAVHHGHQKGIIHRDLKPANLLVGADGVPKVIDFGVARASDADIMLTTQHTHVGDLVGTVHYMSPEQCDGNPAAIDTRSDIYALGVVLYELLTGVAPYETSGTTLYAAIRVVKEQPPRRPSLVHRQFRGDLEAILLKALEKEPARRYASAADLAQDLRRHLAGEPIEARPPTLAYVASRYARRHAWQTTSVVLGVVFIIVVLAGLAIQANLRAEKAEANARIAQTTTDKEAAERAAYRGVLQSAEVALSLNDASMARQYLERVDSSQRKNWEWQHLMARTEQSVGILSPPAPHNYATATVMDGLGRRLARYFQPDKRIEVLDVETGTAILRIAASEVETLIRELLPAEISAQIHIRTDGGIRLALNAAGDELAVATYAPDTWAAVLLFDLPPRTGKPRVFYVRDGVAALAFHPERPLLVGSFVTKGPAGFTRGLLIWDVGPESGISRPMEGPVVRVNTEDREHIFLSFSWDGQWLVGVDWYGYAVRLWNVEALLTDPEHPAPITLKGHTYNVTNAAFSPDSQLLATCAADNVIRVWDIERCVRHAALVPGRDVYAADVGAVRLQGATGGFRCVAFDDKGDLLFAGDDGGVLSTWQRVTGEGSVADWQPVGTLLGHRGSITGVFGLPGGQAFTTSFNGELRLWDPFVEDVPRLRGHGTSVNAVVCTADGCHVISGDGGQALRVWDATTGAAVARIQAPFAVERTAALVSWEHRNRQFVAGAFANGDGTHGRIAVWSLEDPVRPRLLLEYPQPDTGRPPREFHSVAVSANGRWLAAGDDAGRVNLLELDLEVGQASLHRQIVAHEDVVRALAFLDPAGRWLVTGASDRDYQNLVRGPAIRLWDTTSGTELPVTPMASSASICCFAVHPDRTRLAAAKGDGSVDVYQVAWRDGQPVAEPRASLRGHVGGVWAVAFHPSEARLFSSGDDRLLRVWDTESLTEVVALHDAKGPLADIALSPDGAQVFTACGGNQGVDNTVLLWDAAPSVDQRVQWAETRRYQGAMCEAAGDFAGLLDELPGHLAEQAQEGVWAPEQATNGGALANIPDPGPLLAAGWRIVQQRNLSGGQYQRVIEHAERLVEHFPWNAEVHALLGAARYRHADFEAAYVALTRAQAVAEEEALWNSSAHSLGVGFAYLAMSASQLGCANETTAALESYRAWLRRLAESGPPQSSVQDGLLEEALAAARLPAERGPH